MKNVIPEMTHALSKGWSQPPSSEILIDDTHAVMKKNTLERLYCYSHSIPSAVYEGKMWSSNPSGVMRLHWWAESIENPDMCTHHSRIILIVD